MYAQRIASSKVGAAGPGLREPRRPARCMGARGPRLMQERGPDSPTARLAGRLDERQPRRRRRARGAGAAAPPRRGAQQRGRRRGRGEGLFWRGAAPGRGPGDAAAAAEQEGAAGRPRRAARPGRPPRLPKAALPPPPLPPKQDFGARDPYAAEIESNFGEKVLGNYNTDHIIK
jgi:hypothetical protein